MTARMSSEEQVRLIDTLEIFKIKGRDNHGRKILWVSSKLFLAVSDEAVKKYLEERIFPRLSKKSFYIVYFHSTIQRSDNFPGLAALRSIYDVVPDYVRDNLLREVGSKPADLGSRTEIRTTTVGGLNYLWLNSGVEPRRTGFLYMRLIKKRSTLSEAEDTDRDC